MILKYWVVEKENVVRECSTDEQRAMVKYLTERKGFEVEGLVERVSRVSGKTVLLVSKGQVMRINALGYDEHEKGTTYMVAGKNE